MRTLWLATLLAASLAAQDYTIRTLATDATGAGVAVDAAGNIYYPSYFGRQITRLAPDGSRTVIAGRVFGAGYSLGDGGPATAATFSLATSLALDGAGNLYVYDDRHIRRIDRQGVITTVAGSGTALPTTSIGNGIPATALQLHVAAAAGMSADAAGNLWLACSGYPALFRISGGLATVAAGLAGQDLGVAPPSGYAGDGGPARHALLALPNDVAADGSGNLWILDGIRVRRINPAGGITTALGPPAVNLFSALGIAADGSGNVYVADSGNGRILRLDAAGAVHTIAGGGTHSEADYAGTATGTLLSFPTQIAVDASGNVYFASQHDATIRKLTPLPVPAIAQDGIVHAASLLPAPLAPGTLVVIRGVHLQGGRVSIGGLAAPVLSTAPSEIRAVVPFDAPPGSATVVVEVDGRTSAPREVNLVEAAPALFSADSTGKGPGAILNSDGSANGPLRPAAAGEAVALFATGAGRAASAAEVAVTVGGLAASVLFAGAAPGPPAGVLQVNAEIPPGAAPGALPVVLRIGDYASPDGVTVSVR